MAGIVIGVDTSSAFSNVKNLTKALDDLGRQGIVTESEIKKLTEEAKKKFAADDAERSAAKLGNTLDRVAKSCGLTAGELYLLKAKAGVAATEMEKLGSHANVVSNAMQGASSNLSSFGGAMGSVGTKIAALAAGFLSLQTAMQAATTVASMEAMKASFNGIFGDKGAEQFKYVMDSANKYGKSVDDIAGSYKKFAAAAEYVGISTENVRKIFESTTQAITKVGGTSQDVSGALLAISQSLGKGVVMSEEFKGQFAERIPVAMKVAADAMGVTTAEFQKMMESGQVMAVDFWPKIADGMANFSQGWQKSSDTVVSNFERVKNSMKDLAATDIAQGAGSFVGKFLSDSIIQRVNQVKESFRYISVMYQTMQNMQTPELPQFSPVLFSIDELEQRLGRLKDRQNGYITGLKTDIESLTKSLADAQSKQLDFGPSGENVDVMRQKLKWFQDLLLQLTGQTHVVNVTANVDMSQLKQAQSYVDDLIKNTATAKSQAIDTERWKLDNAAKTFASQKSDLEAKLANPTTDAWQRGGIISQIEEVNKSIDKTKIGYAELDKQQKKLIEGVVEENSEVKKLNKSKAGTSESDLTYATQRKDAEELSVAKQIDAYSKLKAGLIDLPAYYAEVARAQEANTVKQDRITKAIANEAKARTSGANAGAKYAERTSSYLEQAEDQYNQLVAMMGGDALGAKIAGIEKRYDRAASTIRQAMIGAKGSTAELDATLAKMAQSKDIEILIAQAEAWRKAMQDAANLMGELGRLSGDPEAIYGSAMTTAKLWEADQKKRIEAIENLDERAKQSAELQRVMALKEVAARADAYEGIAAVSSKYWEAEKQLLAQRLQGVKKEAEDELAFRVYAAQQEDELRKKQLESEAAYAGTFAETLSAKWSLAFGGYKSEMTKSKESWNQMSESIINSTNGMIDGIAGGFGDMIRNIGNGTASIEDLWKNMLARMLDAFASFVEELVKQQLKDLVGGLFSGSGSSGGGISSLFGGSSSSAGSSSLDLSSLKTIGKYLGSSAADTLASGSSSSASFIGQIAKANTAGIADAASAGTGLFSGVKEAASAAGGLAKAATTTSSVLGTVGTALGVVGAVGGLVGLAVSLFGEKKEEIKKVASGYNVGYNAGHSTAYSVDFYSDGSVQYAGPSNPDVQKKISDAFRETAEALSDFAEELGFTIDVLEGFQMPNMNITDDQLDGYIRNGENMMAFKGLMEAGLRGAFDYVARDGEVYVDEYERLSTSLSTVRGGLEAYGYELSDVAMITQEQLDLIRAKNTEVAEGTAQAMQAMAASMGATDDVLAQIARDTPDATAALAATDEQLSSILEADYASDLLDAVGGEEAFAAMMGNLTKNIFDSIGAYAENLDYYTEKAGTAISKLGDASVTVDNFWIKFDEAIKDGLSVDEFEAWGKASTWVNQIDTVTQAMEDWNDAMKKTSQSLDQRMAAAQGFEYQAKLAKQMADAEWELAAAREAGYDAAMLAKIQSVQAAELAATIAKHQSDYANEVQSAQERIATATDDQWALIEIQRQKNALELSDMAKTYNWSPGSAEEGLFQTLQQAQQLEIDNMIKAIADALEKATTAMNNSLDVREAKLSGNDELAEAISMSNSAIAELNQAYEDGLDGETIARLISVQNAEMEAYLASIDSTIKLVETSLSSIMETLVSDMISLIDKGIEAYTTLHSDTSNLADRYHGAADGIYKQLKTWGTDDAGGNPELTFKQNQAVFDATFKKAMTGDIDSLENLSSIGSSLLTAAQGYYGNKDEYLSFYRDLQSKMGQAAGVSNELGDKKSDLAKLYEVQLNLYELFKDELSKEDPNTALLEQIGVTMSAVQGGINTGNTYQETLRNLTQTGTGGYKSIIDAVGASNSSLITSINTMTESQTALMELLERYLNASQRASLESKMSLSKTQAEQSKEQEVSIFRNSKLGNIISQLSVSDYSKPGVSQEEGLLSDIFGQLYYGPAANSGVTIAEWLLDPADTSGSRITDINRWRSDYYSAYYGSLDWSKMYSYLTSGYYNPSVGYDGSGYNYLYNWSGGRQQGFQNLLDYGHGGAESISPTILTAMKNTSSYWAAYKKYEAELAALGETTATSKTLSASTSFDAVNGIANFSENIGASDIVDAITNLKTEIKALHEEVKNMREETNSANMNIGVSVAKTASTLSKFDIDGLPKVRNS